MEHARAKKFAELGLNCLTQIVACLERECTSQMNAPNLMDISKWIVVSNIFHREC